MTCTYESSRGAIQIPATHPFKIIYNSEAISLTTNAGPSLLWVGNDKHTTPIDMTDLRSINEFLKNEGPNYWEPVTPLKTYESGFIDLLNTHSIYIYI